MISKIFCYSKGLLFRLLRKILYLDLSEVERKKYPRRFRYHVRYLFINNTVISFYFAVTVSMIMSFVFQRYFNEGNAVFVPQRRLSVGYTSNDINNKVDIYGWNGNL